MSLVSNIGQLHSQIDECILYTHECTFPWRNSYNIITRKENLIGFKDHLVRCHELNSKTSFWDKVDSYKNNYVTVGVCGDNWSIWYGERTMQRTLQFAEGFYKDQIVRVENLQVLTWNHFLQYIHDGEQDYKLKNPDQTYVD